MHRQKELEAIQASEELTDQVKQARLNAAELFDRVKELEELIEDLAQYTDFYNDNLRADAFEEGQGVKARLAMFQKLKGEDDE